MLVIRIDCMERPGIDYYECVNHVYYDKWCFTYYNFVLTTTQYYAIIHIMNIFILDQDPVIAAQSQVNRHVVKMIVESAQMLSTTHRVLDGTLDMRPSKSGKRMVKYYSMADSLLELTLYKAVHHGHPCTKWTMESEDNYNWHWKHFSALCDEYTYRYDKTHSTDTKLRTVLKTPPRRIERLGLTPFALAMKQQSQCITDCPVESYRSYYHTKLDYMPMVWTKRLVPDWFKYDFESAPTALSSVDRTTAF